MDLLGGNDEYGKQLQIAGAEIAQKLSENTQKNLKKPFLDPDFYTQMANKYFDEELKKIRK